MPAGSWPSAGSSAASRPSLRWGVWGHPGPLSVHQREQVRLHPYHTSRVLDRSPYLRQLGEVAAAHRERLDGSGYFRGARAAQLPLVARLLATADVYQAMTEPRPHRPAAPCIYAKIGVSTRVGATMFAMSHDLGR